MVKKTRAGAVRMTEPAARRLAEELNLELVDVELARENGSSFLRVLIDREGGIDMDTCEAYHRRLLPLVEDVEYDYLEVGSPGADRPLKSPRDYEKAMGKRVELRFYKPIEGAKAMEGILKGYSQDGIVLERCDGTVVSFAKGLIAQARPVVLLEEDEADGSEGE